MCGPTAVALGQQTVQKLVTPHESRTPRSKYGTTVMEGWLRKRDDLEPFQPCKFINNRSTEYSYYRLTMYQQLPEPALLLESYEAPPGQGGKLKEAVELWSCDSHFSLTWQATSIWNNLGNNTRRAFAFTLWQKGDPTALNVCLEAQTTQECQQWTDALETTVPTKYEAETGTPRGLLSARSDWSSLDSRTADLDTHRSSDAKSQQHAKSEGMLVQMKTWLEDPFKRRDDKFKDLDLPDGTELEQRESQAKAEARMEVEEISEPAVSISTRGAVCPDVDKKVTEGPMVETEAKPQVMDKMTKAYVILLMGTLVVSATATTGILCITHPAIVAGMGVGLAKTFGVHSASSGAAAAPPPPPAPEPLSTSQQLSVVYASLT